MAEYKLNKGIKVFAGSGNERTPADHCRLVQQDINSKLGYMPQALTPGPDPEPIVGIAAADPHESRAYINYVTRRIAIFGQYLKGRADKWLDDRVTADARTGFEWQVLKDEFILHFTTDVNTGAAEIKYNELMKKGNQTIMEWNEEVTEIVTQAFGHLPQAVQDEKISAQFKKGLTIFLLQKYTEHYLTHRMADHNDRVMYCHIADTATQMAAGTLGKSVNETADVLANEQHDTVRNSDEENEHNIFVNGADENPRKSNRMRAFCNHCKMNGHSISQCRTKSYDDDTQRIWKAKLDAKGPKPSFKNVFNPTNQGEQPYVRPQGGNRGNEVQNNPVPNYQPPVQNNVNYQQPQVQESVNYQQPPMQNNANYQQMPLQNTQNFQHMPNQNVQTYQPIPIQTPMYQTIPVPLQNYQQVIPQMQNQFQQMSLPVQQIPIQIQPQQNQYQKMPQHIAKQFARPINADPRKNYYQGKPTAFNLNYSRGPGVPRTFTNLPFRNPAPWQLPEGHQYNYQKMDNYYAQNQRSPGYNNNVNRNFNQNRIANQGQRFPNPVGNRNNFQRNNQQPPRQMAFGPNSARINMTPNRYGNMQVRSTPSPAARRNSVNANYEEQETNSNYGDYINVNSSEYQEATQDQKN
jgi:hypothetical protein